jgi:primosomal protein N' (replication factor Y)
MGEEVKTLYRVAVAVELPQHSGVAPTLDYLSEQPLPPGTLVLVPLGRREVVGLVWDRGSDALDSAADGAPANAQMKRVLAVFDALDPLEAPWRALVSFAARYYQRSLGELALSVLPPELRKSSPAQLARRFARLQSAQAKGPADTPAHKLEHKPERPVLTPEQECTIEALRTAWAGEGAPRAALLFGATGSGKTEVFLRAVEMALERRQQALVLVPEINLTPQLEARFQARFGADRIVSLHSALTPAQRVNHWLAAHAGGADVVLGTRLAIFASMPRLGLMVVDEEHDPSYKSQDGARYSARDLAVWRGQQLAIPVILGSATPSLESWYHAQRGHYALWPMPARVGGGSLPRVRLVDMRQQPKGVSSAKGLPVSPPLLAALQARLQRGEQSLVFLNRRGYAPVLFCGDCGWKSACPHCSAWRVFHKLDRTLRCHHCGLCQAVPRACPDCGNLDIAPMGRGTERLEEQLAAVLKHEDGRPARVARIDADSTRLSGSLASQLEAVHEGEVDVLVGTQMVAKGHDFRRVTLVAAINPDGALFSSDFRASERLFALLMQAAGRAGRDASQAQQSEMWVQTWHPEHALYAALRTHDYSAFAATQLQERRAAGLPPWSYLALLRAEAATAEAAQGFIDAACEALQALPEAQAALSELSLYPAVPMSVARVADIERMQMLIEARSRPALQYALRVWTPLLHALKLTRKGRDQRIVRWALDVDPLAI